MATAVNVLQVDKAHRLLRVYGTISASGSYTALGDPLSFSGIDLIKSSLPPIMVSIQSQKSGGVTGYDYRYNPGTTLANGKFQVFVETATAGSAHSELAAGAYPAGVTGDTIFFEAIFLNQ